MARARRPSPKLVPKPAVASKPVAASKPAPRARAARKSAPKAAAKGGRRGQRAPTPYDPEYERPLSELPPLTFPNSEDYDFRLAAQVRRRVRVRNEGIFGGLLVVGGLGALVAAHTPAFLALAAISVVAMVAYEVMISTLE